MHGNENLSSIKIIWRIIREDSMVMIQRTINFQETREDLWRWQGSRALGPVDSSQLRDAHSRPYNHSVGVFCFTFCQPLRNAANEGQHSGNLWCSLCRTREDDWKISRTCIKRVGWLVKGEKQNKFLILFSILVFWFMVINTDLFSYC